MSRSAFFSPSLPAAALALSLGLASAFAATPTEGLRNFHKVDDHVYRGGQPTAGGFQSLAKLGIKTILDLRGPEHNTAQEKRMVEAAGLRYVNIPMRGMHRPAEDQIAGALAVLNDSKAWPVFVHCKRGADRTGTVVACYRIGHDQWGNVKALDEARQYGMSFFQFAMQSFVKSYTPVAAAAVPAVLAPAAVAAAPAH